MVERIPDRINSADLPDGSGSNEQVMIPESDSVGSSGQVTQTQALATGDSSQTGLSTQLADDLELAKEDMIVLPLTEAEFEQGLKSQIWSSLRWVAEWCLLLIKRYGSRVFFRADE